MIINYWLLPIALLLLLFPRRWLHFGQAKRGKRPPSRGESGRERQPGDQSLWLKEEFSKRRNWLDLLRATAGGIAVFIVTIDAAPDGPPGWRDAVFWIKAAILVVAVLIQSLRFEGRLTLFPPVFFVTGLAFGVIGLKPAFFAFATVWAINIILPSPAAFLAIYAFLAAIYGVLLGDDPAAAILAAVLPLLPVVLSVLLRRRLLQFNKRSRVAAR
ncbi:MAG TPA: hypothetical protein VGD81_06535 [Opitutaceae bacterium]